MSDSPLRISVVIPAYNVERWVAGAIDSAVGQDPAPHEVIVVNDGSTDGTEGVLSTYGDRICVVDQENRGLAGARNAGAGMVTGDAIFFLDADDRMLPGALAAVSAAALRTPRWGMVVTNWLRDDGTGRAPCPAWTDAPRERRLTRTDLRALILRNTLQANALVAIDQWRGFPYRGGKLGGEDLDFALRVLLAGREIVAMGEPLVSVQVLRDDALTTRTRLMRSGRRRIFADLLFTPGLTPTERAVTGYQLARSTVGVLVAPSGARQRSQGDLSVLHVYLDDGGGGPEHVRLLRRGLSDRVAWEEVALPDRGIADWTLAPWRIVGRSPRSRIVHAHGVRAAAACVPAVFLRRARLVVTVHGLHSVRRDPSAVTLAANRFVLGRARMVLTVGDSDAATIIERHLARPDRVRTIRAAFDAPEPVDRATARELLGLSPTGFVALWMGRFEQGQKDPATMIAAVEAASDDVTALMAGTGPDLARCRQRARAMGDRVVLPGRLEPALALGAADAFVSTSRWEGLPIAALEAGAAGLPLVLTSVPGNRDLASGVPAVLVPAGDHEAIARHLEAMVVDPDERKALGRRTAAAIRDTFTTQGLAEDVARVYRDLR